jgi:hypothetical protein
MLGDVRNVEYLKGSFSELPYKIMKTAPTGLLNSKDQSR